MRLTTRANRLLEAARLLQREQEYDAGRITEVIVHLPVTHDEPAGLQLVIPGRGRQPALYELREGNQ